MRCALGCTNYFKNVTTGILSCILIGATGVALRSESPAPENARVAIEPRVEPRGSAERITELRADSNLVLIPVTVTDRQNRFVTGLEKEFFKLYENNVEQTISQFGFEDAPISVGVVFDCSGSMNNKLTKSREAVADFLKTSNPGDEFSLVTFSSRPELLVHLTEQSEEIQSRLTFVRPEGRTALLDAIVLSMDEMKKSHNPRKALVIISDGGDNASRYTVREIKNMVRETDVQIFAIGILDPIMERRRTAEEMSGPELLNDLSRETGGRLFEVDNLGDLPDVASKIGLALRNQYVLGYAPANVLKDGKYHRVQVKLAAGGQKRGLRLSWRTGYYAPVE
jgi:Ca-activated chloride channel family protein